MTSQIRNDHYDLYIILRYHIKMCIVVRVCISEYLKMYQKYIRNVSELGENAPSCVYMQASDGTRAAQFVRQPSMRDEFLLCIHEQSGKVE
jgi:hypothetical protein